MIERYLIHYFLAVMDQGNFSRAAQQCRISQPTLSVGIAKLESLVGHMLFQRTNRRVELTTHGPTFALHPRRIEAEFAKATLAMPVDQKRTLIRLGLVSTLPALWIESATREASIAEGEKLEIVEGRMSELAPRLERGRLDVVIGIVNGDVDDERLLFEEPYSLALSDNHPLATRSSVDPQEIADADMIVRRSCEALSDVSRFFTQRGVRPSFSARTFNDDRAVVFVRAGLGMTVMPRCFRQPGIAMPELSGFHMRRKIGMLIDPVTAGRVKDSQSLKFFAETLRSAATTG